MLSPLSQFTRRSLWPVLTFFLVLSIGLNAFLLLVDRLIDARHEAAQQEESEILPLERGPLAFGPVAKGFQIRPKAPAPSSTMPGVQGYEVPDGLLPILPSTLLLYRDQGIGVDRSIIDGILAQLFVPVSALPPHIFARALTLRSLDRTLEVLVDIENRVLMLTRLGPPPALPPPSTQADDATVIALAKEYLSSLGLDASGQPTVVDQPGTGQSPGRTFVVWHATFDGYPLMDEQLQPVARITVQVGRVSHRVVAALVNLLDVSQLTRSAYPVASHDVLRSGLKTGGMSPLPVKTGTKAPVAMYASAELVYVLSPATKDFPLYVVPALRARYRVPPTCASCAAMMFDTFIPALDPLSYAWIPGSIATRSSAASQPST